VTLEQTVEADDHEVLPALLNRIDVRLPATFGIAAGVSLFELSRFMGTSAEQIDKTYGHLLPDALERKRQALDSFLDVCAVIEASV
jgi:hypothetical protein